MAKSRMVDPMEIKHRTPEEAFGPELEGEHMLINIGPQHPATHGVLRLVLELDGETVVRCIPHVGYLHCGFEKIGEYRQYNQIIPWTDREDYLNSMGNNVAFVLGRRAALRDRDHRALHGAAGDRDGAVRIISHLVWLGTTCIDIGAFTPFLWCFQERENVYNLLEGWTGARLTTSGTRVGGMIADVPDGWVDGLKGFLRRFPKTLDEVDAMLTRNAIWVGRTVGPGGDVAAGGAQLRLSGPMLRASGVAYDVRKDFPYLDYETYDFDVPVGDERRRLRPLPGALEEMQAVGAHPRAGAEAAAGRAGERRRPARHPPAQAQGDERDGEHDPSLQARDGRPQGRRPARRTSPSRTPKGEKGYYFVSDGTRSRCAGASGRRAMSTSRRSRRWWRGTCSPTSSRSTPPSTSSWERSTDEPRTFGARARARRSFAWA
jgi:NADH-quinone oxidoreductase subunit D